MKLLLTGASGLVGFNVARAALAAGHEVVALSGRPSPFATGPVVDFGDERALRAAVAGIAPELIVNAAAMSEPAECERSPALSELLNVELPARLARAATELGARLIHFSSEQVFDGTRAPYRATDPVTPVTLYGRQKAESERRVAEAAPRNSLSVRLPLLAGNSASGRRSLHERLFGSWSEGRPARLYRDELRQPCTAEDVARLVLALAAHPELHGVAHWAGRELLSRFEMGSRIARHFDLPLETCITPALRADDPNGRSRQENLALDCSPLVQSLGRPLESSDALLAELRVPEPYRAWYERTRSTR